MNTKRGPLGVYAAGRTDLLLIAALTTLNLLLVLFDAGVSFLFSAFFPQIAMASAPYYGLFGLRGTACILAFAVVPTAMYYICWALSAKKSGWMWIGAVLFLLDTLYMVWFVFGQIGFQTEFLPELLFHLLALVFLMRGAFAGVSIRKMGSTPQDASAQNIARQASPQGQYYVYDAAFAKQNGAKKTGAYILTTLGFAASLLAVALAGMWVTIGLNIDSPVVWIAVLALIVLVIAAFSVALVRLEPYVSARWTSLYVDENGTLCVMCMQRTPVCLAKLQVEHAWQQCWDVTYECPNGKRKKYTIANAYPGLEAILDRTV